MTMTFNKAEGKAELAQLTNKQVSQSQTTTVVLETPWHVSDRLDIYRTTIYRPKMYPRDVFQAWYEDTSCPVSIVTIREVDCYVEWAYTNHFYRGSGFAKELLLAIDSRIGPLSMSAVTRAGEALEESFYRTRPTAD